MVFENFHENILLILIIQSTLTLSCNKNLVTSYGMKGLDQPKEMIIEMCPTLKHSCCQKADQKVMFGNWVVSKEEMEVKNHYQITVKLYSTLLKIFKIATKDAERVLEIQKLKKVGNCKFISQRIVGFEIRKQIKDLEFSIGKFESFFEKSFKGVYCSICDADLQRYFNAKGGKVWFSQDYCRSMMQSTLTPLLYFHNHFVKVANLISRYLTSCTFKGEYVVDTIIPKNVIFKLDKKNIKDLDLCRKYRNEPTWFVYCKPICKHFKIGKFSKFFDGQRTVLNNFLKYAQKRIKLLQKEAAKQPLITGKLPTRLLAAKKKTKKKLIKPLKKVKENKIFTNVIGAPVRLDKFISEFLSEGLNLLAVGSSAAINKAMFNQVKNLLIMEKASNPDRKLLQNKKNLDKGVERKLNGLSKMKNLGILLLISLII